MTISVIKGMEDIEVSNKRIAKDIGNRALSYVYQYIYTYRRHYDTFL